MKEYKAMVSVNTFMFIYKIYDLSGQFVDVAYHDRSSEERLFFCKFTLTVSDIMKFLDVSRNYVMVKVKPFVEHVKCKVKGESLYFRRKSFDEWINKKFKAYRRTEPILVRDVEGGQLLIEKVVNRVINIVDQEFEGKEQLFIGMMQNRFKEQLVRELVPRINSKAITWQDKKGRQCSHSNLIFGENDSFVDHQRLCPLVEIKDCHFSTYLGNSQPEKISYVLDRRKVYNSGKWIEFKDIEATVRPMTRYVRYWNEKDVLQVVHDYLLKVDRVELLPSELVFTKVSYYS